MASTMFARYAAAAVAAAALFTSLATASTAQSGVLMPTPSVQPKVNALSPMGCFDDPTPMLDHGPYTFQTSGNCQFICVDLGMTVMGLTGGTNCWCGNAVPPMRAQVSNDTCSTPCAGYDKDDCGGSGVWTVYLTGITQNKVPYWDPDTNAPATQTLSHINGPSVVTVGSTVVQTVSHPTSQSTSHKGGASAAGIAAGVVVGIIAIGAMVLGGWFFLRQRRRREIEEEHRRAAAVNEFVKGGRSPHSAGSVNDTRLDSERLGQRRMSDGSIADNEDYSRRILKVTNA